MRFRSFELILVILWHACVLASAEPITKVHRDGYCAMRGHCMEGLTNLNCPYNGPAVEPETSEFRQLLVQTCGEAYASGKVCCDEAQLKDLQQQVTRAEPMIASCPACWSNFMQFWCAFTCSPNQSTFVNVTRVSPVNDDRFVVEQVDYWVGDHFGSQFYDSCKQVKFGVGNAYAMQLIGGGAKSWHEMVTYMGQKRALGSPFQIDFPPLSDGDALQRYNDDGKACNDTEPGYRCACVDCEAVCPVLEPIPAEAPECVVGSLKCWSFAMVMTYGLIVAVVCALALARKKKVSQWIQRLIGFNLDGRQEGGRGRLYERVALADEEEESEDANLLDPDQTPRRYWLNSRIQIWFYRLGVFCARHPWSVIAGGLFLVALCSTGWHNFAVERDPVNLWVAPSSQALAEKNHFDSHFTPFYRTTQLFFVTEDGSPIASAERLESLFKLEDEIKDMKSDEHGYRLQDVCFHPSGDACIIQSVTGYWQGDLSYFDPEYWDVDLENCLNDPVSCLPQFLQPIQPEMVLGGYQDEDYMTARAFVVTFVLKNSLDPATTAKAEEWEKSLLKNILLHVNDRPEWEGVRITFSTESSLETELNKSSNTDAVTVAVSYLVMFVYASLALGRFRSWNPRRLAIDSKFTLGVCGILIVIFSVSTAVGIFSRMGKKTTLIIAEVIPFLVLAVGVDNIFILCHEYARREETSVDESIEERLGKTLGKMGPSILLSSLSETIAFGLGTLVTMPAVSSFATVASIAIFVDFVLQVTCFVACMALDARRVQANRLDCMACIRIRAPEPLDKEGWLESLCRVYYAPNLLKRKVRYTVCLGFLGLFMVGLALTPELPLGLDQRIALPSDSYLVPYFNDLDEYFNVGPPVFFVVQGANMTDRTVQKKICGRFPVCDEFSLANVLELERRRANVSYIGQPTSVWLDDFLYWLNPNVGCCRLKKKKQSVAPSMISPLERQYRLGKDMELCDPFETDCEDCKPDWSASMDTLPEGQEFLDYFHLWIGVEPDPDCPLNGKAAYGDAVVADDKHISIDSSYFRTFHTPLRTQQDFIAAHASARRIADDLRSRLQVDVYPYSVFYIFFEQYSYIVMMAFELLGLAILAIFIITSTLLGSLRSGTIVLGVVIMILVDVMGVMTLWGVSLNALSLVNLVICVGISVEFCCHIARGFMVASGSREERASKSLVDVGSSVFCGITLTKFAGIVVLAFTRSKIFEVYYFRMYLAIVLFGALHGLVLLPVLLAMFGGEGMSILYDFDEDGFAWSPRGRREGLLVEDNESYDQVLVTDFPEEEQQQPKRKNGSLQQNNRDIAASSSSEQQ